jgi:hypothetical protein
VTPPSAVGRLETCKRGLEADTDVACLTEAEVRRLDGLLANFEEDEGHSIVGVRSGLDASSGRTSLE